MGGFGEYDLSAGLQLLPWLENNKPETPESETCRINERFLWERDSSLGSNFCEGLIRLSCRKKEDPFTACKGRNIESTILFFSHSWLSYFFPVAKKYDVDNILFEIITANEIHYYLQAASSTERTEWIKAIQSVARTGKWKWFSNKKIDLN